MRLSWWRRSWPGGMTGRPHHRNNIKVYDSRAPLAFTRLHSHAHAARQRKVGTRGVELGLVRPGATIAGARCTCDIADCSDRNVHDHVHRADTRVSMPPLNMTGELHLLTDVVLKTHMYVQP